MALILIDNENLEFLKVAMHQAWPNAESTHRLEGLAAALGFKTYAALLTNSHAGQNILARVSASEFENRMKTLGSTIEGASLLCKIVRDNAMPSRLWAEFKRGDLESNNYWFRECRARGIPMIYVEPRTKYAELSWDCISLDNRHDHHFNGPDSGGFVRRLFARFQQLARGTAHRAEFFGSAFVGNIDGLSIEMARDMADEFYIMLCEPLRPSLAA